MSRTTKDYVLSCAKAQGKLSKLLMNLGEGDTRYTTYHILRQEIQLLKEAILKDDPILAEKVANIHKGGKINTGAAYTDVFGWGNSLNTPAGGWPSEKNGMVYSGDKESDTKPLPFGRVQIKTIALRGQLNGFFREEEKKVNKNKRRNKYE